MTTEAKAPVHFEMNLDHIYVRCMRKVQRALTFRQFAVHSEFSIEKVNNFSNPEEPAMTWQLSTSAAISCAGK